MSVFIKMSQLYAPTLKESPAEAELASHKLMLRSGMIRKSAAGIYSFLPLGWRSLHKVEQIVREEMDGIGAQEMCMTVLQPAEIWHESGRWSDYGPELMRLKDRHDREFCLGPTHEELITTLIRGELRSYKDLPVTLYQIQVKFRDEMRPRFGLLRGREFIMKDAYSFHDSQESLDERYEEMSEAYGRICDRLGLEYYPVVADSGQIGGSVTTEFLALSEAGESELVYCECGFAANTEVDPDLVGSDCPKCGKPLSVARGIEVSQVFQLGDKYSKALNATYSDEEGNEQPFLMGCYGVGVSRSLAAVIEQHNDERGITWPISVAPAEVAVIPLTVGDEDIFPVAERIARELVDAGIEVVLDDRDERPGVKFADADLIGWPVQIVVGKKGIENGIAEVKIRINGERMEFPLAEVASTVSDLVIEERAGYAYKG